MSSDDRKESDEYVKSRADYDDAQDSMSHYLINSEQKVDETREEEKDCDVHQCWDTLHHSLHAEAFNSSVEESTDTRFLVRRWSALDRLQINARPLLN